MGRLLLLRTALLSLWLVVVAAYNCNPECQNGACVAYLGNLTCECTDNWSGPACDQFICETNNPCLNDGVCAVHPDNPLQYICACPLGYTGDKCQYGYAGDNCSSNPCGMNGTCYSYKSNDGFYCDCDAGHYGPTCNFTVSKCTPDFCGGRGTCKTIPGNNGQPLAFCTNCIMFHSSDSYPYNCVLDFANYCAPNFNPCDVGVCSLDLDLGFRCTCSPGWGGMYCNETFDVCAVETRCSNGGTCEPDGHYFNCTCPPNFTGEHCEYMIDPCVDSPCQNEGRCVIDTPQSENGYYLYNGSAISHCECVCGYSGPSCSDHMTIPTFVSPTCPPPTTTTSDPCTLNPCTNNGVCNQDNSILGFYCTCPVGYSGLTCNQVDHCASSPCGSHSIGCVNGVGAFYCRCKEGWGGEECDMDIDECLASPSPCNDGNCTNIHGNYTCTCPEHKTGSRCEIALDCSYVQCANGGVCRTAAGGISECECPEGFTGDRCEREVCPDDECLNLAGNGVCNQNCFRESCNFDGGDCYARPNPNVTTPWVNCSLASTCIPLYRNGQCDVECNTPDCLYDGLDCIPSDNSCPTTCAGRVSDGVCSIECNTTECPYDTIDCQQDEFARNQLVLIVLTSKDEPFVPPWSDRFIQDLNKLTNSIAVVVNKTLLTRQQLAELDRSLIIFPRDKLLDDPLIYRIVIKLDVQYCLSQCPEDADDAADWIQATLDSGAGTIGPYRVADAYTIPDQPNAPGNPLQWPYAIIAVGIVLGVLVVGIIAVIVAKRKRPSGDQGHSTAKRIRAMIWRPESPASDASNSRSSPANDRRRRPSGPQGTSLVSKDGTPAPPEDPDKYIAKGSIKAKMEPSTGQSQVEWQNVHVPLPSDSTHPESTEVVVGQKGQDKRKWTRTHYEALKQPQHVRELVDEYRQKIGSTNNVNARGPGGFTPLMLVVMKRHSSHESVIYPSRGSSESGSDHNDHTALLPSSGPTVRMGLKYNGRPVSNSSVFSHDTAYYTATQHVLPIDSSVGALIEAKVDLDVANDYGQTALHLACACSRGDYVEQLLEAGANPNVQDNWGQSSLQAAIVAAAEGAFMLILNHSRTDLDLKSDGGITPLIAAVKVVNQFMVKQLLKKNVDIGATDSDGRTAVHWSAMVDNLEALKLLIRQGPDAVKDAQDNKGQTALFLACREGSAGCVKHLLDCFANATLLDSLDQSPVQIAYQKQHMEIVEMLRTTAQGPFPMHSQAPHMRGFPNMVGGFPPHFTEGQSQYCQQLVHPRKSKQKHGKQSQHAHSSSIDSMGHGIVHTPTFVNPDGSYYGLPLSAHSTERHQTFGDLSLSSSHAHHSAAPLGSMPMTNFGPPQAQRYDHTPLSGSVQHAHLPPTSSDYVMKKSPPDIPSSHPVTTSYLMSELPHHTHPITPPDSATLVKARTTSYSSNPSNSSNSVVDPATTIAVSSATGFDEIQAVSDLITSMADNPPVTSTDSNIYTSYSDQNPVYPETSIAGSMRLQHLPLATEAKLQYPTDPLSSYHRGGNQTSPPQVNSVGSGSGSPSSVYPSPPHSNELHPNFHGYQYPTSSHATCSPPSLTPSPESREEALARQQLQHEIMTESYSTVLPVVDGDQGMGHVVPHHHYHLGYPPLESSV